MADKQLPSLFAVGTVIPRKTATKREIDKMTSMRAIDYIMDFIAQRTSVDDEVPAIRPRGPGDRVILLRSGTGSGKTVAIPPELYMRFSRAANKSIVVTQPRILTVVSKAQEITKIYKTFKLGTNLSYQTSSQSHEMRDKGVILCTVGVLTNQLRYKPADNIANRYQFIVVDEIHDRSRELDELLMSLKALLTKKWSSPTCPLIILMSATFERRVFAEYFDVPNENFIEVSGVSFPIENHFADADVKNCADYAMSIIRRVHTSSASDLTQQLRDFIVFVSGKNATTDSIIRQISKFNSEIASADPKTAPAFIKTILLTSTTFSAAGEEYRDLSLLSTDRKSITVTIQTDDGPITRSASRVVVLSTPFAETGVTLNTIKYCIDTGYALIPEYNPDFGIRVVKETNVTQGMAWQRRGRAGRIGPGVWYPCYTKDTFEHFEQDEASKILKEDLSPMLLAIIIEKCGTEIVRGGGPNSFYQHKGSTLDTFVVHNARALDMSTIDFIEYPPAASLISALEKLFILGFIGSDYMPTELGMFGQIKKINIESCKLIFSGFAHGVRILDLITIAAFLNIERSKILASRYKPRNPLGVAPELAALYTRTIYSDAFLDYLILWEEYEAELTRVSKEMREKGGSIKSLDALQAWCDANGVRYAGLLKVAASRFDIIEEMLNAGYNVSFGHRDCSFTSILRDGAGDALDEIRKFKRCIYDAFKLCLVAWNGASAEYTLVHKKLPIMCQSPFLMRPTRPPRQDRRVADIRRVAESEDDRFGRLAESAITSSQGGDPLSIDRRLPIAAEGHYPVMDLLTGEEYKQSTYDVDSPLAAGGGDVRPTPFVVAFVAFDVLLKPRGATYSCVSSDIISVLDGFVDYDLNFTLY